MSNEREDMNEERAPRRGRRPERALSGRRRRVPMGTPELKLMVQQAIDDPDHHYRWINDHPGRIAKAIRAGYEFVEDPTIEVGTGAKNANADTETRINRVVGTDKKGYPMHAYLMRIKRSWYDEDQEKKQAALDEVDDAIREGQFKREAGDGRYVPKEGISIK